MVGGGFQGSSEPPVSPQTCLVCRRGDDDEHLLLCDGCDRGCHLYCHRPRMTEVPEGDWFCSVCVARVGWGAARTELGPPILRRGPGKGEKSWEKSPGEKKNLSLLGEVWLEKIVVPKRDPDGSHGIPVPRGEPRSWRDPGGL